MLTYACGDQLRANRAVGEWTSVEGIHAYVQALLRGYAALPRYRVRRHERALRFTCTTAGDASVSSCRVAPSGRVARLRPMHCSLTAPRSLAPSRRSKEHYSTLHEASLALLRD